MASRKEGDPTTPATTNDDNLAEWAAVAPTVPEEIQDLQRRIVALDKQASRYRSGTYVIRETLSQIFKAPPKIHVPRLPRATKRPRTEHAVLHVSDTQLGKITTSYDMRVARQRLLLLAQKTVEITDVRRAGAKIDTLHCYLGGDLVEGEDIFPHQAHLIDQPLLEQAVKEGPMIFVSMLLYLLSHFRKIHVKCVAGNHGKSSFRGHPRTNWDTVCSEVVRYMLLGSTEFPRKELLDRLTFEIADADFYIVDTMPGGWGNLLVHGHQIKGGFGGFPFYGVGKKVGGWADTIAVPWDYLWFGHFHTFGKLVINHRLWLANGTTESDNEYAHEQIASQNHPCQRLAFFTEKQGLIADHQVFLDDRVPQARRFS